MSRSELEDLFQKFLGETMTQEELARFRKLFNSEHNRDLRDRLMQAAFTNKAFEEPAGDDRNEIFQEIIQRIQQKEKNNSPSLVIALRRRSYLARFGYAAAIILVIVLAGSALFLFEKKQEHQPLTVAKTKTPLVPGGNKAILTLADGSTITLDNAKNGMLSEQGNTRLVKLDSGLLAYNPDKEKNGTIVYNTITTPRGGQYQIVLPDGTHAWLNAASSLKFPTSFSGKQRKVTLTGEGYFEVTKNKFMPFVVEVGRMEVSVLGTSFNIMAYSDEDAIKTTLVTGSVKVTQGANQALMQPGQQAQLKQAGAIKVINDADLDEALAWKNGRFQFNEAGIEAIMRQIGRWYDVDIAYKGELSGVEFSGSVSRKEYAAQLLELLEGTRRVRFITEGKKITVVPYK